MTVLLSDVTHFGLRCQGIQFIERLRDAWSPDYPSIHFQVHEGTLVMYGGAASPMHGRSQLS